MLLALEVNLKGYLTWTVPQGSYHVWCKLMFDIRDMDILETCIHKGVMVVPGAGQTGIHPVDVCKGIGNTNQGGYTTSSIGVGTS